MMWQLKGEEASIGREKLLECIRAIYPRVKLEEKLLYVNLVSTLHIGIDTLKNNHFSDWMKDKIIIF